MIVRSSLGILRTNKFYALQDLPCTQDFFRPLTHIHVTFACNISLDAHYLNIFKDLSKNNAGA